MMKPNNSIVLYPSPAMGHLISMVELAKLILSRHPSLSVTILMTTPPYNTGATAPYITAVSKTTPLLHFHHLPTLTLPAISGNHENDGTSPHHETLAFDLLRRNNPNVCEALRSISNASTVRAFIIDFFCFASLDVAVSLNIDTYFYFTSGAAVLASFFHFPTLHKTTTKSFKDHNSDELLYIPGILTPIPAIDMPKPVLDREDKAYEEFLCASYCLPQAQGIILNTFDWLETHAIKTLRDSQSLYCIGPLIGSYEEDMKSSDSRNINSKNMMDKECMEWLDKQPSRSVVFLCFGSLGLFSRSQLKEIAVGLERSGERFLWVVRSPPEKDRRKRFLPPEEPNLTELLPEGFLERTKERGLVVKSWAPQVKVLNHSAVGGFVTHCGWNSVLEAIMAGVAMVGWPLYAEQRFNRVVLVEELKLCLSMEEEKVDDEDEEDYEFVVRAEEVEKKVRTVMGGDGEAREVRERILRAMESARAAVSEGGSSYKELDELVKLWVN